MFSAQLITRQAHTLHRLVISMDSVIWVRQGHKTVTSGEREWRIAAGSLLIAPRGCVGNVTNTPPVQGPYQALALGFPLALIQEAATATSAPPRPPSAKPLDWASLRPDAELLAAIERACATQQRPDASARLQWLRQAELLELLALAGVRFATTPLSLPEQLWQHLSTDPAQPWTLAQAAAHFACSPSTLRRKLAAGGSAFSDILREVRLERGLGLLQTTQQPIGLIAHEVGFASASRFASAFKARYGFVPSVLRDK